LVKYTHETINRHGNCANLLFEFNLNFTLPKPRKARLIIKRDEKGRIVRSEVPKISNLRSNED